MSKTKTALIFAQHNVVQQTEAQIFKGDNNSNHVKPLFWLIEPKARESIITVTISTPKTTKNKLNIIWVEKEPDNKEI